MRCRMPVPRFSLVPPLIVSARYWSQTISTLVDRFKSWRTLGQNTLSKYKSKVLPWTVVPGSERISTPPSIIMKSLTSGATSSSSTEMGLFVLASMTYTNKSDLIQELRDPSDDNAAGYGEDLC